MLDLVEPDRVAGHQVHQAAGRRDHELAAHAQQPLLLEDRLAADDRHRAGAAAEAELLELAADLDRPARGSEPGSGPADAARARRASRGSGPGTRRSCPSPSARCPGSPARPGPARSSAPGSGSARDNPRGPGARLIVSLTPSGRKPSVLGASFVVGSKLQLLDDPQLTAAARQDETSRSIVHPRIGRGLLSMSALSRLGVRSGVEIEPDAGRKSERIETNGQAAREGKRLGLKPVGTNCSNFKDALILTAPVKNANSIFANCGENAPILTISQSLRTWRPPLADWPAGRL